MRAKLLESIGLGALGATIAVGFASGVDRIVDAGPTLTVTAAVVGGLNGAVGGWRRIYSWQCSDGVLAFVLDSSWALLTTSAGLFANGVAALQRNAGYADELSERQNRQVFRRGFVPRRGYAITLGNVIGGVGDTSLARKRRLVTDHEAVHVWQARWFGPFYVALYAGWMIVGGAVGAVWWLLGRRSDPFVKVVETTAYYLNPFEWWAYSRHGYWPPSGKIADMGWQRPCCRPLAEVRGPQVEPAGPVAR